MGKARTLLRLEEREMVAAGRSRAIQTPSIIPEVTMKSLLLGLESLLQI